VRIGEHLLREEKMPGTLAEHWEALSPRDRQVLIELLQDYTKHVYVQLGSLPFISTDVAVALLRGRPNSRLFRSVWEANNKDAQLVHIRQLDFQEYEKILRKLTWDPNEDIYTAYGPDRRRKGYW
jgi:hypothetical protein